MSRRSLNARRSVKREKKVFDHSNTKIHTEELAPLFKCDDCEFEGLSYKAFNIHKGKQQDIGAQADGIDNEDVINM